MFRAYAPRGLKEKHDFSVTYSHDGRSGALYTAAAVVSNRFTDLTVSHEEMSFCSLDCDFEKPVRITIRPSSPKSRADVRPYSLKLDYQFDGQELTLVLDKPVKFSVEFDGDMYHNLFVFANEPVSVPQGADVLTFGPGTYDVGELKLSDGQTLYLDGDAVLFGHVLAAGKNITVTGRGILSGEKLNHDDAKPRVQLLRAAECKDFHADGITLIDAPGWTFVTHRCDGVTARNLKQICFNVNSDGFDICGSRNVLIENCFVRNWDDSISLKSFGGDNLNIVCRDTVMWADRAHNMLVGPESRPGEHNLFKDILFENIDVLEHKEYSEEFQGVMAIFCADGADFENITWRKIRIERMTYGRVFDFRYVTLFAKSYGYSCKNVVMEDISCLAPVLFRSRILGLDEAHTFDGVAVKNMSIHSCPVLEDDPTVEVNEFTSGVRFA